jgi:hypothetical protein
MSSLQYLTVFGWVVGHGNMALPEPKKYLDKLYAGKGIYGRFVDDGGVPTYPTNPRPDPIPRGKVPITRIAACIHCNQPHSKPFECLL